MNTGRTYHGKQLLLTMLFAAAIELPGANAQAAGEQEDASNHRPSGPVIVVAGGSQDWHGVATNRIVSELTVALGRRQSVQVLRFDAEPTLQNEQTVQGTKRDLVVVSPRMPLKDVVEKGLLALITIPGPRTMIIVGHEQLYPSVVSSDRLWELARQWEIRVDTIYVESNDKETGVRRLGRRMKNAFKPDSKLPGQSSRDTRRLLHLIADVTGGEFCVAKDEATGIAAANEIATDILKMPGRDPQLDSRSECIPWLAELSENKSSSARR